ncbi:peptide chain release factor N(5)-glutamine methyltransferase [Sneathiella marina]|uniref:Release factor glutamine methyltransferase n=1 Tax=Sneathiella marina TaxID=2950108 RepID=A0ABY4W5Y5_9PROT|nr:peptide chain release factor N(5)-glutamine methyltransferase [Sneathiella marina]USG60694.1 peptide chain release factor N(5)-glutamine methyltransferase [Sneathiella marina]
MVQTLQKAVSEAAKLLSGAGVTGARRDAALLMANILESDVGILYLEPDRSLTNAQYSSFQRAIERRALREPISHILGHREFWSLDFLVGPDVLDPRPDSETLIETVLMAQKSGQEITSILDLGVGSGCLLLSLLSEIENARGTGVDQSQAAIEIAIQNARRLGLEDRTKFQHGNWCDGIGETFDLVISNPPYIPASDIEGLQPEVKDFEPLSALIGGEDGLDCYRDIVSSVKPRMNSNSLIVFEVGAGQAQQVSDLLENSGFSDVSRHKDLAEIERCVSAFS